MSQQDLLKKVIQALDQAGIRYMITGSVVSSLQGEPRSTHDIDIVVAIKSSNVRKLVEAFPHFPVEVKNYLLMPYEFMRYSMGN